MNSKIRFFSELKKAQSETVKRFVIDHQKTLYDSFEAIENQKAATTEKYPQIKPF